MNVPAWPIPIHQTKLMIPNAQATGMLLPQTPMPVETVYADHGDEQERRRAPATPKRDSQPRRERGVQTGDEELVGELRVGRAADEERLDALGSRSRARSSLTAQASSGFGLSIRAR